VLERWVGNEVIEGRLREAGFTEVRVTGSGGTREAEGLWSQPDATAEMPSQIFEVIEA
jgi:hypothetical protein